MVNEIKKIEILIDKLEVFLEGNNSLLFANEIEGDFINLFYEDDEIFNVADAFAHYTPSGGEFLFKEADMIPKCKFLIKILKNRIEKQGN